MKKISIILLLFIIILTAVIPSLIIINNNITARVIDSSQEKNINTFTKKLCNSTNFCQDYKITCWGNQVIEIKPVSNNIQFEDDLNNPKTKELIRKLCE